MKKKFRCLRGRFGFYFNSLVQAVTPDGLHGQWTEIHPKVGKKLVLLLYSLHIGQATQVDALFCPVKC